MCRQARQVPALQIRWSQTLVRGAQSKDAGLQSQTAAGDIPAGHEGTFLPHEGGWVLGQPRSTDPALKSALLAAWGQTFQPTLLFFLMIL